MSKFVIDMSGRAINQDIVQHFSLELFDDGVYITARLFRPLDEMNRPQGPKTIAIKKFGEREAWEDLRDQRQKIMNSFLEEIS